MQYIEVDELTAILARHDEIAVVDTRLQEEFIRDQLFASVNIPYDRLDVEAPVRIPRRSADIVVVARDHEEGERACLRFARAGYRQATILRGGVDAWKARGLPTFQDVNAESKAFGEYVEHAYGTPNIDAEWLHARLLDGWEGLVVDCRPLREHRYAHVPGAVHVPGGDLYRALPHLAPDPATPVVVHCGGRTRGIIAAQGLINAGFGNPVFVLRNGTMGWHLSGYELERGAGSAAEYTIQSCPPGSFPASIRSRIRQQGIEEVDAEALRTLVRQRDERTLYLFDLRNRSTRGEHAAAGLAVAAGQLVQATDEYIAVRGARVVLVDDDFARAHMTAGWLRQMGWRDTFVHMAEPQTFAAVHDAQTQPAREPDEACIGAERLDALLGRDEAIVVDVSQSHEYLAGHVPGAGFCPRAALPDCLHRIDAGGRRLVIASKNVAMSAAAARDLRALGHRVEILEGGNETWALSGRALALGAERLYHETSWLNEAFRQATVGKEQLVREFVEWELERFFDPFQAPRIEDAMMKYLSWEIDLLNEWQTEVSVKFGRYQPARRPFAG